MRHLLQSLRARALLHAVAPPGPARPGAPWRPYALAVLLMAGATFGGFLWTSLPDSRNLALLFFGAILIVGVWQGLRPALFSAVLAFFSYNFFLIEPRFRLHFAPADALAFIAFLVGALLVGGLSGRLSDRARDATMRLRDLTALFEASRDLSAAVEPGDAARRVVRHIEMAGARAGLWLEMDGELQPAAASADTPANKQEVTAFLASPHVEEIGEARWLMRLTTGERVLGAAVVWPGGKSGPDRRWLAALLELGAVAIDRARLINEVTERTIIAEREGLRTALLSSLSHDLRTPIASILASATALQEQGAHFDDETRRDMLETIQEESERLNRYVGNLLEMTRLESGALQVRNVLIDPGEAMASALERVRARLKGRRVLRAFDTDGQRMLVDPVLVEQALVNVLENAIGHSPPGTTIFVSTRKEGDSIVLAVEDEGPGIPAGDLKRVFDKFFQGQSDRRSGGGVGLGLSVARGLVEAFGGDVRAMSPAAGGKGARIEFRLPAHPALEPVE